MCGRGGVAGVVGTTSHGSARQAQAGVYAKSREWYSGSSSLSGGEEWIPQGHREEIKKLRAQIELLSKQQGAGKSPEEPSEPARRGSDLDEGCRVEVEEEVQSKKKLDEKERNLQRQMRDIDKLTFMEPASERPRKRSLCVCCKKSKGKGRTFCLSNRKLQKRSQKLQSLQDKKKHYLKEACASEEETQKLEDMEKSSDHTFRPRRRSRVKVEGLQVKWKRRFGSCKLERKGEEVVSCSQTDAVGIQRCWSSSFPLERQAASFVHYVQQEFARQEQKRRKLGKGNCKWVV